MALTFSLCTRFNEMVTAASAENMRKMRPSQDPSKGSGCKNAPQTVRRSS